MVQIPSGLVITSDWLREQNISAKLAWWYVHSNWLEKIDDKVYKKYGDNVTWVGAVSALQTQLHVPIHIGGKTALQLLGQAHFIPMQGIKKVTLFTEQKSHVPQWILSKNMWHVEFKIHQPSFFQNTIDISIVKRPIEGTNIYLSSPELAILEILYLVPSEEAFDEVSAIMEGLRHLRPNIIQQLLESCTSIKVKRLFLYLAEKYQHTWLTELNISKINLGHGKRVIAGGGSYNSKYQISIPKIEEE
jgi:hypothetical protein